MLAHPRRSKSYSRGRNQPDVHLPHCRRYVRLPSCPVPFVPGSVGCGGELAALVHSFRWRKGCVPGCQCMPELRSCRHCTTPPGFMMCRPPEPPQYTLPSTWVPFSKLTTLALKKSLSPSGIIGTGAMDFIAGPARYGVSGAQGCVFNVGDAYYAHDSTSLALLQVVCCQAIADSRSWASSSASVSNSNSSRSRAITQDI